MTTPELLNKLHKITKTADRDDKKKIKQLRKVLDKLKKKQRKLEEQLKDVKGKHDTRKKQQEIEVLKLQRTKGVRIYKELKGARKPS